MSIQSTCRDLGTGTGNGKVEGNTGNKENTRINEKRGTYAS